MLSMLKKQRLLCDKPHECCCLTPARSSRNEPGGERNRRNGWYFSDFSPLICVSKGPEEPPALELLSNGGGKGTSENDPASETLKLTNLVLPRPSMRLVSRVINVSSRSKKTNPDSPAGPNTHSSWSMRSSVSRASCVKSDRTQNTTHSAKRTQQSMEFAHKRAAAASPDIGST